MRRGHGMWVLRSSQLAPELQLMVSALGALRVD